MIAHGFIFARGGSKGLPRKNILPLGGKPLICHSIDIAQQVTKLDKIFVVNDTVIREIKLEITQNGEINPISCAKSKFIF